MSDYDAFFSTATGGLRPYSYQSRLAMASWPELLNVPTGLGKTAAVTLAWCWKRGLRSGGERVPVDTDTPRRLVWCLPMRVLAEQTAACVENWLQNLAWLGRPGQGRVSVHLLMGGEEDLRGWATYPEEEAVLVGTQDMLLSRALMRGYGASRYRWPIDFALLHNDAFWVFDEVQLMGAGIATSAQLEAFRRRFGTARPARSLWLSATLRRDWLATVDLAPLLENFRTGQLDENEKKTTEIHRRHSAVKRLARADTVLDAETAKSGAKAYCKRLAEEIASKHLPDTTTLVVLNTVERAQGLYSALGKYADFPRLLVHARFRAHERRALNQALTAGEPRIIVATQAVEAGIDLSARTLFTELAPWSSLVQRFGRCNRHGEHEEAHVWWIDITDGKLAAPYTLEAGEEARNKLTGLSSASPADLPVIDEEAAWEQVIRSGDFLDLFDTDPDLSGFDVDVSPYIRDADDRDVLLFWRDLLTTEIENQPMPAPDELCRAPIGEAKKLVEQACKKGHPIFIWNFLERCWVLFRGGVRPGITLMLDVRVGGYDPELGMMSTASENPVDPVVNLVPKDMPEADEDERLTLLGRPVPLKRHLCDVEDAALALCESLGLEEQVKQAVAAAARWHDVGKAHPAFQGMVQRAFDDAERAAQEIWAKSPAAHGRPRYVLAANGEKTERRHFRHELASMLAWLAHRGEEKALDTDLVAYLILAHHGKLRMRLRSLPGEREPGDDRLFCRGVWAGDCLPEITACDRERIPATELRLDLMQLGVGAQGPSWTARAASLLERYGPFRLAWMETLVRLVDWRASDAAMSLEKEENPGDNVVYGLENKHHQMAGVTARAQARNPDSPHPAQGGSEHGVRGRGSGSGTSGEGTQTPAHATRLIETTLGLLSYAELAPHLAREVERVQLSIAEGAWDEHSLNPDLFLELHKAICGSLTPQFAGRWRRCNVVVGTLEPPAWPKVPLLMKDYCDDLDARRAYLPEIPDDRWLELLAFAEGRLLYIHPFEDFNGRVTRLFIDWLTRWLDLPDIDPTPEPGEDTERYLEALRAADKNDWRPLMKIWAQRLFSEGAT